MKYPVVLPFSDVDSTLAAFDTIIDVRSPSEFAEDHIPGAINCPVLDDAQRVEVGTIYKQVSAFDAKKIGAAYAASNIAIHITTQFRDKPREWKPLVYCWRGGNRSGSMAHILAKIGWPVVQLDGGYKGFRNHVIGALDSLPEPLRFEVVCGATGTGKTRLLQQLALAGAQVLDLEDLARHRGSVLGNYVNEPQPSQKMFESRIWQALRGFDSARTVYVESESKKVGNLRVPDKLMHVIRQSPCLVIDIPREERLKLLSEDYEHFVSDKSLLEQRLNKLVSLFGHDLVNRWNMLARQNQIRELVSELLDRHYDPAYSTSIKRNFTQFAHAKTIKVTDCSAASYQAAAAALLADTQD